MSKRSLAIILAALTVFAAFSLASCSLPGQSRTSGTDSAAAETVPSNEPDLAPSVEVRIPTPDEFEKTLADTLASLSVDFSKYTVETKGETMFVASLKNEEQPNYVNDPVAHLTGDRALCLCADSKVTPGMKVSELAAMGWSFADGADAEKTVGANALSADVFFVNTGQAIRVRVANLEANQLTLTEGRVGEIILDQYAYDEAKKTFVRSEGAAKFTFGEQITEASSFADVIKALGAPENVSYYIMGENGEYARIIIDYRDNGAGIGSGYIRSGNLKFTFTGDAEHIIELDYIG